MSFGQYLKHFIKSNSLITESEEARSEVIDTESLLNQLDSKLGGSVSDKAASETSFDTLRTVLDSIPLEYTEEPNNAGLFELFKKLTESDKIDFVELYSAREKNAANALVDEIKNIDFINNEVQFVSKINRYSRISERLLKLYYIFNGQREKTLNEDDNELENNKIDRIISNSLEGGVKSFNNIADHTNSKVKDLQDSNDPTDEDRLQSFKDLLSSIGLEGIVEPSVKRKSKKEVDPETAVKRESIKNKKRIITRLIRTMSLAQLPAINDSTITSNGDFFKLFKALDKQNSVWMDHSIKKYVFKDDQQKYVEFDNTARNTESPIEENQLIYLLAARSWIQSYIQLDTQGVLTDKETDSYITSLNTTADEKEKEIKNYYLSRDFNLGNFGGIQLKPEIRIPLYGKVKLAVTEEDRKKESPLRIAFSGFGNLIKTIFSQIPDNGNKALAKAANDRNRAILSAVNGLIKAGVSIVGGKQAARDYDKMISKLPGVKKDDKLKEDMLSPMDAPGYVAVNPESPGQFMQTPNTLPGNNMDMFSLAGPGKTKSKKKKKLSKSTPSIQSNRVISFSDFLNRKAAN